MFVQINLISKLFIKYDTSALLAGTPQIWCFCITIVERQNSLFITLCLFVINFNLTLCSGLTHIKGVQPSKPSTEYSKLSDSGENILFRFYSDSDSIQIHIQIQERAFYIEFGNCPIGKGIV